MKKDVTRSPHASKIPPTTSPSGSVDASKASQATSDVTADPSPKPKPQSDLDMAYLLRSSYSGGRPLPKPRHLQRRQKEDPTATTLSDKTTSASPNSAATESTKFKETASAEQSQGSLGIRDSEGSSLQMGGLASNSMFAEEADRDGRDGTEPGTDALTTDKTKSQPDFATYQDVLNPRPKTRAFWQRRMVIRSVRRRGRLTKEQVILRTERTSLSKSHFFKTSIKKLAPLARQIAGKPIDEAILQMRFSKKKAAREVVHHLRHAKNEAIVRRGMGLGLDDLKNAATEEGSSKAKDTPTDSASHSTSATTKTNFSLPPPSNTLSPRITRPLSVQPRVRPDTDLSQMYIAQAWVNRGAYGKELDHRAQGRINFLRPPHTGLSVLLKEERTKLREQKEKEEKAERRRRRVVQGGDGGMWTAMPDRKITTAENHVLW